MDQRIYLMDPQALTRWLNGMFLSPDLRSSRDAVDVFPTITRHSP